MQLSELLSPDCTKCAVEGASKKRLLENISQIAAPKLVGISRHDIFESLLNRERLGSTGIGNGVAIPHARSPHCSAPIAGFLKLAEAIDFDAIDGDPVDLVFVLLVPEEADDTHLSLLGQVATIMNDVDTLQKLRKAGSQRELLELLTAKIREQTTS